MLIVWLGTGTQSIHKDLEKKIAEFHKTDDTILYTRYDTAQAIAFLHNLRCVS